MQTLAASWPIGRRWVLFVSIGILGSWLAADGADADSTASTTQPSTELPQIVVTATRTPTPTSEVGSSVTVVTSQQLENEQVWSVGDALRYVQSVNVTSSGGPGQITSVFTRGADSDHTLVLIDGIEANDPTSPTGAFDFSTLTLDDVDHIEVIRGPQSTLWGSDAIGGVINIVTRQGSGPPTGYVYTEDGSFETYREGGGISGGNKTFNYSFSDSQIDSNGIPAADSKFGNTVSSGYHINSSATRLGWNVSDNLEIDFIARYVRSQVAVDDHGGAGGDNPNGELRGDAAFFRVQPRVYLLDGKWVQTFGVSYTYYDRQDTDPDALSKLNGGLARFDWQNDFQLAQNNTLTTGLVLSQDQINASDIGDKENAAEAYYLQDAVNFNKALYLTAGTRYDHFQAGGSDLTYRFTGAYLFPTDTTLRASYGTGFKAPTLEDLYSSFGSPTLKAERSTGWDAGVEQGFFDHHLVAQATYFSNSYTDLIDFNFATNREDNIGKADSNGVELGLTARPTNTLSVTTTYTYTQTEDLSTGGPLLRRPRNAASVQATWDYSKRGQITAGATYESDRPDIDPITFAPARIPGYIVVNVATSYRLTDHLTLTARIENLCNEHYEQVDGYGEPGFGIYGGIRLGF